MDLKLFIMFIVLVLAAAFAIYMFKFLRGPERNGFLVVGCRSIMGIIVIVFFVIIALTRN